MTALGIMLAHMVGDYLLQSHWMASEKVKRWWPAVAHGLTYTLPYLLVTQSREARRLAQESGRPSRLSHRTHCDPSQPDN